MGRRISQESGFTLVEVVVAIAIITTLVASFGPLIASSIRNIHWAGSRIKELYELRGQMERKMATLEGAPTTITVRGRDDEDNQRKWVVEGVLVALRSESSGGIVDLVSFVIPKE